MSLSRLVLKSLFNTCAYQSFHSCNCRDNLSTFIRWICLFQEFLSLHPTPPQKEIKSLSLKILVKVSDTHLNERIQKAELGDSPFWHVQ